MRTKAELEAKIDQWETKMFEAEAELKTLGTFASDEAKDLIQYINGLQGRIYALEWATGERAELI